MLQQVFQELPETWQETFRTQMDPRICKEKGKGEKTEIESKGREEGIKERRKRVDFKHQN